MTDFTPTNWRALCAELVGAWIKGDDIAGPMVRARYELAQPEPVALTRPECFDFAMDFLGDPEETEVRRYVEALEARAALLPEPVAPTDEELDELAEEYLDWNADGIRGYARAVWSRAQTSRPAIEPVPVSERLPGPEDCDAEGRCWTGSNDFIDETGDRPVPYPASWELRWILNEDTHWLPHWALPVPGVEGDNG